MLLSGLPPSRTVSRSFSRWLTSSAPPFLFLIEPFVLRSDLVEWIVRHGGASFP